MPSRRRSRQAGLGGHLEVVAALRDVHVGLAVVALCAPVRPTRRDEMQLYNIDLHAISLGARPVQCPTKEMMMQNPSLEVVSLLWLFHLCAPVRPTKEMM